jgi:hypothetical protein
MGGAGGGDVVGNGGNAVLCITSDSTEIQLFDFYEAKILNPGIIIDLGSESLTVQEKINYVLERLKKNSPKRAANYKAFIDAIFKADHFVDEDLVPVDDSHNPVMPKNCHLQQLALHLNPKYDPYNKKVLISKKIYQQLDKDSQAGIFIHEAIYDELISIGGGGDSSGVRFLNSMLSSREEITLKSFIDLLINAGLEQYEYHGLWLEIYSMLKREGPWDFDFYPDTGGIKQAHFHGTGYRWNETRLSGSHQDIVLKTGLILPIWSDAAGDLAFRSDGSISSFNSSFTPFAIQGKKVILLSAKMDLHEFLTQACFATVDPSPISLLRPDKSRITLSGMNLIDLDPNGYVTSWKRVDNCLTYGAHDGA